MGREINSGLVTFMTPELARDSRTEVVELNKQIFTTPIRPIGRRALLISTILRPLSPDVPLHIVNLHLSYLRLNPKIRHDEWKKVFKVVGGLIEDVIITGDFNARPQSRFIQRCNTQWQPVSDQSIPTFHSDYPIPELLGTRTLDYVYKNSKFRGEVKVSQLPKGKSDHIWHCIDVE